jgi:hypothetical protein
MVDAGSRELDSVASSLGSYYTTIVAAHELRRQRLGAVARALWAWVARARRKVVTRIGSSAKEQYGHEEYAQNFDEGAAAVEPENLSRSFSARFARRQLAR